MDNAIEDWVLAAGPHQKEFREAVHIILMAVAGDADLQQMMIMKGGILLALRYGSSRFTRDIDFSTPLKNGQVDLAMIRKKLEGALALAVDGSDYGLDCRVQKMRLNPDRVDASFPGVEMTIGYAYSGTRKHRTLLRSNCTDVIAVDLSLNEPVHAVEEMPVDGNTLRIYGFSEAVAEKYRALLQQEEKNKFRRQDVFDLNILISESIESAEQATILASILEKSHARDIDARRDSLDNPELKRRAKAEYATLADEIEGELPDFEVTYSKIKSFYEKLPWPDQG